MEIKVLIGSIILIVSLFLIFKKQIRKGLYRINTKLQFQSLRTAIHDADSNKDKTGRKNIVVYNTNQSVFEPVQKRQLKVIARKTKNKSNKAMTPGRIKMMKNQKRVIGSDRIKLIEKKSLYVTR